MTTETIALLRKVRLLREQACTPQLASLCQQAEHHLVEEIYAETHPAPEEKVVRLVLENASSASFHQALARCLVYLAAEAHDKGLTDIAHMLLEKEYDIAKKRA